MPTANVAKKKVCMSRARNSSRCTDPLKAIVWLGNRDKHSSKAPNRRCYCCEASGDCSDYIGP